jgi:hypothetical protein
MPRLNFIALKYSTKLLAKFSFRLSATVGLVLWRTVIPNPLTKRSPVIARSRRTKKHFGLGIHRARQTARDNDRQKQRLFVISPSERGLGQRELVGGELTESDLPENVRERRISFAFAPGSGSPALIPRLYSR